MAENDNTELVHRPTRGTPVEAAEPVEMPQVFGATFAERAAGRVKADKKVVSSRSAENKAVSRNAASRK